MKLSLIIEAIVRGKAPLEGVTKSVKALDRAAAAAATGGLAKADRAIDRAERSAGGLTRSAERMGFAIGSGARRGVTGLLALERRMTISRQSMGRLAEMAGGVLGRGIAVGAAVAGAGVLGAAYKIVTAGMMFEKFRTQLTGLEGSVAAGNKAMDWVTNFARTTPYEIGEVMEAFIQLKAYGLDPTNGTLKILGDTAGGMGKSLSQAVEMIADASTGEFERLKEFGVKASQKGDQVTFSFTKNGKQMTRVAKKTAADIDKVLFSIFADRFAGGMDRLASTTEGKWSNVMDRLTISAKRVWEGGLSSSVNKQLDRFSTWVDGLESSGNLGKWAASTGKGLGDLVAEAGKLDWQQFGKDISDVAGALHSTAIALRELSDTKTGIAGFLNSIQGGVNSAGAATNSWLKGVWDKANKWNSATSDPLGAMGLGRPLGINPGEKWKLAPQGAPRAAPPKATIDLRIRTDRGTDVSTKRISANGVDVGVQTGSAMAPFA